MRPWPAIVLVTIGSACDGETVRVDREPGCNPLGPGDHCSMPFPSALFEVFKPDSATGRGVAIPSEALPANRDGAAVDPGPYNRADGYSPATSILVHLGVEPSTEGLVPHVDPGASLEPGSPTVILDMDTGERVAHFAEVDQNAVRPEDRVLILRPVTRLRASGHFAVALTESLRSASGEALPRSAAFDALVSGAPTDSVLFEAHREELDAVLAALGDAGVAKSDLLLAWDFTTSSNELMHQTVLEMRRQALEEIGDRGIGYQIDEVDLDPEEELAIRITGTFESPLFLSEGGGEDGVLVRDADGLPVLQGIRSRPFTITIPPSVVDAGEPRPLIIFGHGLLGDAFHEMSGGAFRHIASEVVMSGAGSDWAGLSQDDQVAVARALIDFNEFELVTDKLQQAVIDTIALTRTVRGIVRDDPALTQDGVSLLSDEVYYYGASLGGTMGSTFLAYNTDVIRGVLNVPGAVWSQMIHRSADWPEQRVIFENGYEREIDRQLLIALSQTLWDPADPISTAPHMVRDPLEGTPAHLVLLQESVADAEVTNIATENMARTMGVPLLSPSVRDVWGLEPDDGPVDSALSVWDTEDPIANPAGNVPAPDNDAHGAIRRLPALIEQIRRFFRPEGQVEHTCDGPCDPE
ncbi:MAG: hypothetical protein HYY06_15370 [Deltaproteobacteria bacterium]|nr:hypothetical protein [Deltaproteobacteria bacterium]